MSQLNAPMRRSGGGLDVYTGLLFAALVVLAGGVALMALRNVEHSGVGDATGGPFTLVEASRRR